MSSSYGILLAMTLLSLAGIASNLFTVCYIFKRFDTKKTVFLLLLIDASICCVGCAVSLCCYFHLSFDWLVCLVLFLANVGPGTIGNFIMMQISLISYLSLRNPYNYEQRLKQPHRFTNTKSPSAIWPFLRLIYYADVGGSRPEDLKFKGLHSVRKLSITNNNVDERKIKVTSLLLIPFPFIYIITLVFYCVLNDTPFSIIIEMCCAHGSQAVIPAPWATLGFIFPNFLFPTISLISDAAIVCILKRNKAALSKSRNVINKSAEPSNFDAIPVKATVLSAFQTVIPTFGVTFLSLTGFSKTSLIVTVIAVLLIIVCRNPAVTFISFHYRSKQMNKFREETREMKLRKVLKDAQEENSRRKMMQLQQEDESNTL